MKLDIMRKEIELPSGVTISVNGDVISAKGPKGAFERKLALGPVNVTVEGNKVVVSSTDVNKRKKRVLNTNAAHVKNIVMGVSKGVNYKLKICAGHFPMNVTLSGDTLSVKNFLGEKVPRTLKLPKNVKVTIDGQTVNVDGVDLELVSQAAASIEKLTRRSGFDFNRFQDGIYIVEKNGEKVQ